MIYVGVDWADKAHSICVLDEAGAKLEAFEISHSRTGFEAAHERLSKHAVLAEDVRLAIETKDSLLVDFLLECGYRLYFLNPRQTDRFRDRHRMSSSKSDSFDAFVLEVGTHAVGIIGLVSDEQPSRRQSLYHRHGHHEVGHITRDLPLNFHPAAL